MNRKPIRILAVAVIALCVYSVYKVPSLYWSLKVKLSVEKHQTVRSEINGQHVKTFQDKLDKIDVDKQAAKVDERNDNAPEDNIDRIVNSKVNVLKNKSGNEKAGEAETVTVRKESSVAIAAKKEVIQYTEKGDQKDDLNNTIENLHAQKDHGNDGERVEAVNLQHGEASDMIDVNKDVSEEDKLKAKKRAELESVLKEIDQNVSATYNYKIADEDPFDGEFVYEKKDVEFDINELNKYDKEAEDVFKTFPNYQNATKYLIYYCNEKCGGFADRLKGISAVYMMSILTERKFAISMTTPCEIERFLKPNLLDWRYPEKKEIIGKTLQTIDCFERHDAYEIDFQKYDPDPKTMMNADVVQMKANQDWTRVYRKLSVTPRRFPQLYQYHSSEMLRIIYKGLFKLSPDLKELVDDFITEQVNGSKLACLHARMGEEVYQRYTYREILIPLQFLKRFDNEENFKVLVATDTENVKKIAAHMFRNFVDTSGPILHIDYMVNGTMTKDRKCAGFMRSMVDHVILQNCNQLVLTGSGFGVTAASIRHTSHGVYVYMRGNAVMPTRRELIRESFQWRCLAPDWKMKFYRNICDS